MSYKNIKIPESGEKITLKDGVLTVPNNPIIPFIEGDGIGSDITPAMIDVEAGKGCPIFLKRTHKNTLKYLPIETLKKFAIDLS